MFLVNIYLKQIIYYIFTILTLSTIYPESQFFQTETRYLESNENIIFIFQFQEFQTKNLY